MARILFVDNHASTREICSRVLRARGHEVIEACNGRTALDAASCGSVDAVVTDWVLPDMSSDDFFERLEASKRAPRIIVYSNQPHLCPSAMLRDRVQALIAKAEDLANLLTTVDAVCGPSAAQSSCSRPHLRRDFPDMDEGKPHVRFTEAPTC